MRLKQVRLNGFKSFCDDTEFNFNDKGITIIVGPNGCGKSNVVDAVRWALGEQAPKQMRSASMSDVIFAGSTQRKPVGRAEVTLLFDNTDRTALEQYNEYTEIAVTRRLYRNGESEYLINKTPARLMDVRELVMDTGAAGRSYSIVEQGRVDEFITASPVERRAFMEEAAGIVRYKVKRLAAEKKLEQTRQNLLRVEDILRELNRQEALLREQTETAREFLAVREQHAALAAGLARLRLDRSAERCGELERGLEALRLDETALRQQVDTLGVRLHDGSLEHAAQETRLRENRETLHAKEREIQQAETELALAQQNRRNAEEWKIRLETTLQEVRARRVGLAEQQAAERHEQEALGQRVEALRLELTREEAALADRRQQAQSSTDRVKNLHERLLEAHTQINGLASQQEVNRDRTTETERRSESLRLQRAANSQESETVRQTLTGHQSRFAELAAALGSLQEVRITLEARLDEEAQRLQGLQAEAAESNQGLLTCRSRLESLSQIDAECEGFGEAVRTLLNWLVANPGEQEQLGILGPLADLITVPGEVAAWAGDYLAPHLETIIIRNSATLPELAARLKTLELGGVRVLALDGVPAAGLESPAPGIARLVDKIRLAEPARALGHWLFGATGLLDPGTPPHLPEPRAGLKEWLVQDGHWHVDQHAQITLGRASAPASGILQRRAEIAALKDASARREEALVTLRAAVERQEALLAEMRQQQRANEEQRNETLLASREVEQNLSAGRREAERLEAAAGMLSEEERRAADEMVRLTAQRETLTADEAAWKETRLRLEGELAEARIAEDAERTGLEAMAAELTERKLEQERLNSRAEALQLRIAELIRQEEDTLHKLEEAEQGLKNQTQRIEETGQAIVAVSNALATHREALETLRGLEIQQQEVFNALEMNQKELAELLRVERRKHEESQERIHKAELTLTQEKMRLEQFATLLASMEQAPPLPEPMDEQTLEQKVASTSAKLKRMEGVNLAAPQEYDQLTERLGFLTAQQGDLLKAVEDLESSIRKMNNESRRRFKETFDSVNEKFQTLFPKVFGGGEAKLVLTDSEDVLEAGVDIFAQPPGKKLQSLNLLSGGEKALTAISLIFSFFLYKPSPFCVLDEVDAPLDDMNVTRFNSLIGSMTEHSQFIIITHNKRTMEVGDTLYGVTMEEAGVSKVVSVNLTGAA